MMSSFIIKYSFLCKYNVFIGTMQTFITFDNIKKEVFSITAFEIRENTFTFMRETITSP